MRTPRKLYLLISRKSGAQLNTIGTQGVFTSRREAELCATFRNANPLDDYGDWRVETFVKGD